MGGCVEGMSTVEDAQKEQVQVTTTGGSTGIMPMMEHTEQEVENLPVEENAAIDILVHDHNVTVTAPSFTNSTMTTLSSPAALVKPPSKTTGTSGSLRTPDNSKRERKSTTHAKKISSSTSRQAVTDLQTFLEDNSNANQSPNKRLQDQPFASVALTRKNAQEAQDLLWKNHVKKLKRERATEIDSQRVTHTRPNGTTIIMKYWAKIYHPSTTTTKNNASNTHDTTTISNQTSHPKTIPLFIGLHGGGGCPPAVNDGQWENHKKIYHRTFQELANTTKQALLYVAPRAPTNNWNLWHEPHMDDLLDRLIANLIVASSSSNDKKDNNNSNKDNLYPFMIDSNRVYISGYSAGGDGIYMLAPRMADRWAAASMMAGHPNGISLRGIYNLPFSLHVGGEDEAYKRNAVARQYKKGLESWQQQERANKQHEHRQNSCGDHTDDFDLDDDGGNYKHIWAKIYEGKGHGLGGEDAAAFPWMAKFSRNTHPKTLIWDSGSSRHSRFYWVVRNAPQSKRFGGGEVSVSRDGQTVIIDLTKCPRPREVGSLTLRFHDNMMDMDKPVAIHVEEKDTTHNDDTSRRFLQEFHLCRTIGCLHATLQERLDPNAVYNSEIRVDLGQAATTNETHAPTTHLRGKVM